MAFVRIEGLECYKYKIPLKTPIIVNQKPLEVREGLIIKITDENQSFIYTEAAPLPFLHSESLLEIESKLSRIKNQLINSHWSLKLLLQKEHLLKQHLNEHEFPSLYFALEFGLLSHLMPKVNFFEQAFVNALLTGSDSDILKKAGNLNDYESIKLKVGKRTPKETLELIDKIRPFLLPHQRLRIDINRAWDFSQACYFCNRFPIELCEYLEEPLKNPVDLLPFSSTHNHPLAFDESLLDAPLEFLLSIPTKRAFIIKPSLIGSLQSIHALYTTACKHQLKFILTSCFESGLGHLMVAHLAHYLGIEEPIGLDTYRWLEKDTLLKPLEFSKGLINLQEHNFLNPYLNLNVLSPL